MQNANQQTKKAVLLKIFAEDIELFGKFFFPHYLKNDIPEFHKEIYKVFEDKAVEKIAIGAPRAHAKSTLTDLVYLAWVVCNKKANFVLLISDTYSQSVLFLDALKGELESNEQLKAFYGKMTSPKWAEGEIVANDIMIKSLGAGMKVRGLKFRENRPDLIVCDDLENDESVENKDRREKFERWFTGALLPSMAKNGRVIVIGTILHFDSLLAKLLDTAQYIGWYKKTYRAINDWGALWPEHLDLDELEKIKQEYISQGQVFLFYQEYQNDPVSSEFQKFKLEKFKYYEDKEILGRNFRTFITIDRSYSLEKTADFTAFVVVSVDRENRWYVRLAERVKGTEKELIEKIFDLHSYFTPELFGIEQKAYKYTIKPALDDEMRKRNVFFRCEELKDMGRSKNVRIEGLIPRFEAGSVYLKRDQTDMIDELIKFPKGIHDDLVDSLSYQLEISAGAAFKGQKSKQFIPKNMSRRTFYNVAAN
jgi:predicted phage terminase large subunit-like protein